MQSPKQKFISRILAILCCLPLLVRGQSQSQFQKSGDEGKTVKRKGQNLVAYDDRFLHYGFFLAVNKSQFRTSTSPYFRNPQPPPNFDTLKVINTVPSIGFTTGFILNVRLFEYLDFRLLPTVSFYQRYIEFENKSGVRNVELKQSTFSFIELPMMIKFKSQRRNNSRMYLIGGIKPALEVGSKKKEIQDDRLRSNVFDFNIEYGCGFDLYYPLFKFSPEIRFSHGLINLKVSDPNEYARSISSMLTHTVTLYFNFE